MTFALVLLGAYLIGSIPFGYIAGRINGVDVRTLGSGNIGAANIFRNLGKKWGIGVLVADLLKGLTGALLGRAFTDDPRPIFAGAAVMAGAIFPIWLKFKGGKGVATGAGVAIGLFPLVAACVVPLWFIVVGITRITSVGSLASSVAFVPIAAVLGYKWPYLVLGTVMAILVIVRHRENISRLIKGTEAKIQIGRRGAPKT